MGRIGLSVRVFFATLFRGEIAEGVDRLLSGKALPAPTPEKPAPAKPKSPQGPVRSEAITLLAALQREARFVDFIQEPLEGYSDAQIGAASRDVHRQCGEVLNRLFAIQPQTEQQEMSPVEVPEGFDSEIYRLTGDVQGDPPYSGKLVHHGWQATRCDLPTWNSSSKAVFSIAPIEVELG